MKNLWLLFTGMLIIAGTNAAQGQVSYYVRSGATGNGSDWNNALPQLPSSLARGATYYVSAGNYGGFTLAAVSGTSMTTIKKATISDHGTDVGWNNNYGTAPAVFVGTCTINQAYLVFDGQTGGGPGSWTSGFGFQILVTSKANPAPGLNILNNVSYVTAKHFEVIGNGGDGNQVFPNNDAVGINAAGNITISYAYLHDMGRCLIICLSASPLVVEYVYGGKYEYASAEHSEIASMNGNSQTFRYNVFSHVEGTGGLMFNGSGFDIYGNVFFHSINDTSWNYAGNGIIGSKDSSEPIHNARIYNNTFYRPFSDNAGPGPQIFGFYMSADSAAYNNIFYGQLPATTGLGGITHNYNHFVDVSGGSAPSEPNKSTATGNPFVNAEGLDFMLTANTPAGTNLGAPYNVDPLNHIRSTWTRGAYEFVSGGTTTPTPVPTASPTATPAQSPQPPQHLRVVP